MIVYSELCVLYFFKDANLELKLLILIDFYFITYSNYADLCEDIDRQDHHFGGRSLGHNRECKGQDSGQRRYVV